MSLWRSLFVAASLLAAPLGLALSLVSHPKEVADLILDAAGYPRS